MAITDKLTEIANQVRALCGTTNRINMVEMASNISDATAEIDEQTELISQIISILESKTSN